MREQRPHHTTSGQQIQACCLKARKNGVGQEGVEPPKAFAAVLKPRGCWAPAAAAFAAHEARRARVFLRVRSDMAPDPSLKGRRTRVRRSRSAQADQQEVYIS